MEIRTHYPTTAADGARRLVSVSEIAGLDCWRRYRWSRAGLQPIRRFEALNFGIAWDEFMGIWWGPYSRPDDLIGSTPVTPEMRLEAALMWAHRAIDKEARRVDAVLLERNLPRPRDWQDELERMHRLIDVMGTHYAQHYGPESDWRCVAQQVRFEVPFPSATGRRRSSKFWLHGVIDRIMLHLPTGELSIWDDKTAARITPSFYDDFDADLQLPLYSWAMRELGNDVKAAWIDAAAKLEPVKPEMRQTPFPVYELDEHGNPRLDEDGKPINVTEPERDEDGNVVCFKSGPRAGQPKLKRVTRPGLHSMFDSAGGLQYLTTYDLLLEAIEDNGLDPDDYTAERELLMGWKHQDKTNPYFGRADLLVNDAMMDEAAGILRDAAPWLDKLPDVPMRSRFRCSRCVFRVPCLERDPAARADLLATEFTTRDERTAHRKAAEAVEAEQLAAAAPQESHPF